ncbi:toll/interleukin-1 receptor domain-containing protein [Phocaeicola dorei]|jgi:SEFIR domain protein|uniref:toll/interleukin-1 receptor domain-containing protein n=1 Tax=Phocaeicola dorei TaxID=357276 RepID=UPI001C38B006|nr:toll/interleukin-1 receptor domain-containing protein [Phocaeicola dorei]MBV4240687.1 toll/interleukin-1 receptor domain-containing protein [Phocaeicola dorei]MCB6463430.1 toll/interleukin-1 receptor domain-containing protein [Phocaeicola dorei]MCB6748857.1 toll/interleukin-1 receptor domain-containing protein [Phocaeicola dorei]MCB6774033.1 toll/interleukin-1 receptor domain-containing protein [Phocaeicola dorei]MCB6793060.1 toll/interleukin-1 receptor domain-containing protein [Phocaeicol
MSNFSDIPPSQFDDLVKDHPVVFISYSWDSEDHKSWVRKLSDDLRTKYAVNTLLDQYNRGGYDLIQFMNKGIEIADRVILIGTPAYKEKSENMTVGQSTRIN